MIYFAEINKNNYINIIPKENILVFSKFNQSKCYLFIIHYNSGDI